MDRDYLPSIAGYIHRPRLDALYREALAYLVALVIAGPGYGKTLSVAHFLGGTDLRLIWMRVTALRSEASEFWEDFTRAAARELPAYAKKLEELDFPVTPGDFELFRQVTAETTAAGRQVVLVVDNYERIVDKTVTRFIDNLMDSELPNFTLFILCNIKLPFAGTLPAQGQFRVTDAELAFTAAEAVEMFCHYGHQVGQQQAEAAIHATGGWPLGLRLVCASPTADASAFSNKTTIQLAAELFEQQYFQGYPPEVRAQLLRFALLPQFALEMTTGGWQAGGGLYHLLQQHPFVSYNYATGLYVLQPMYHDFLRQKQGMLSQESRREACAAGGRWFLEHHMPNEAMDCFWEAADYDGFLAAIASLSKVHKQISLTNRVLHRLEEIPRSYASQHPEVDYCIAFMYLNAADAERARELLLSVEGRLLAGPQTEENRLLLGDTYAVLADIGTYLNEDTGLAWTKKAAELIPNGSRVQATERLLVGNNSAFFLPDNRPGQLEHMVDYVMEFAVYADKVMNGSGWGFEYLFAGEAAYFREDMDKAAAMFNSAILKAQLTAQHDIVCNALWGLARIEVYFGNYKNARALLNELEAYINDNGLVVLYELRDCALAWFYMLMQDYARVPAWFGQTMGGPEKQPVTLGRNRLTTAAYLLLTRDYARAYAVVLQAETLLGRKGRWHERFSGQLIKALCHLDSRQLPEFEAVFGLAYDMVYQNDIKLGLAVFGKQMMTLIDQLRKLENSRYDMDWLEVVYRDALSFAKRLQTMRRVHSGEEAGQKPRSGLALTRREDETLRYLAQGLTQQEIAKLMGISSNAVKKHVAKIYQKLGAVNRADAIHIASINGLVDIING